MRLTLVGIDPVGLDVGQDIVGAVEARVDERHLIAPVDDVDVAVQPVRQVERVVTAADEVDVG